MAGPHILEIPLPEGLRQSPFDLDMLGAMLHAILSQRFELSEQSESAVQDLEREGWSVRTGPTWLVVARRGESVEEATGRTPDEAIARLYQYLRYESGYGCP